MSPAEARIAARRAYGSVEQAKQAHRDERSLLWVEQAVQDLRYGVRTLSRSPGFTITTVLTLALGIGACSSIFSPVNAVLIRSLPYGEPGRLVYLYTPNPRFNIPPEGFGPAYADLYDIKRVSRSFARITAFDQAIFSLAEQGRRNVSVPHVWTATSFRLSKPRLNLAEQSLLGTINPVTKEWP